MRVHSNVQTSKGGRTRANAIIYHILLVLCVLRVSAACISVIKTLTACFHHAILHVYLNLPMVGNNHVVTIFSMCNGLSYKTGGMTATTDESSLRIPSAYLSASSRRPKKYPGEIQMYVAVDGIWSIYWFLGRLHCSNSRCQQEWGTTYLFIGCGCRVGQYIMTPAIQRCMRVSWRQRHCDQRE